MSSAIAGRMQRMAAGAGGLAIALGVTVLLGYVLGNPALAALVSGHTMARPNAALGLLAGAVALLLLLPQGAGPWRRRAGRGIAALVLLLGSATSSEYLVGWDLGIDRVLFPEATRAWGALSPGRMSLLTALSLTLLGGGLLGLDWETRRGWRPAQGAAVAVATITLLVLLGYTFGEPQFTSFGASVAMSIPVALGLALLAAGMLLARPECGWMRLLSSAGAGGVLVRSWLPVAVGAIWLLGWLSIAGSQAGWYSTAVDQVFFTAPLIFLFVLLIFLAARSLERVDQERRRKADELEQANRKLEERVEQRTAQLAQTISQLEREMAERRQAEAQLRQSSLYARSLLEASLDPLVTISKEGKVMDVNRATEEVTGVPRARLIGSDFCNYFTEPEKARQGYQRVFSEGFVQDYPLVIRQQPSGRMTEVLYNATLFRDEHGQVEGVFAAARDVTERRRAEREMQRLNRALHTLSECNEAVVRAADEASLLKQVCDIAVGVGGYRMAWVGYAEPDENKTVRPLAQAGAEEGYLGTVNITWADTERGRGPTGTAIRTGRTVICEDTLTDPRFAPWREEAQRRGFRSSIVLPLRSGPAVFGSLSIYAEEAHAFDASEQRLLEELAADLSYGILALRARREVRALNAELEERVRRRTAELEESNRELESFTYSVSHDLRAPLRHIDGFSKMLLEEYGPHLDENGRRYLERVRQGTQFMGRLVDDLLNLSRVGRRALTLQITGLGTLVEEVRRELASEQEGREVEWRTGELPFVECDPGLMKQVLANLLSNALKFTRPRARAVIEVGQKRGDGGPVIFVRDNGVGFHMKYADKLFGIFQRLHRQEDFEGTGVGLATVERILHKHGGKVWAEAELDKGATFYFTLGAGEIAGQPAEQEAAA